MESELILSLQQAYKRMTTAGEEVIEATLAYAQLLLDARRRHPSDLAFGQWLVANELDDLPKDDRAAFLKIAEPPHPDLYRRRAPECGRSSPRYIWQEEIEPQCAHCRYVAKPEVTVAATPETPRRTEETPDSPAPDPDISGRGTSARATTSRSPLKEFPQSALVLEHVRSADTRSMLIGLMKKRSGRAIWDLLVESIKTGTFGPPAETAATTPNLRLILPWAPTMYARRINLLDRDAIANIRENIMPVVLANRDTLLQQPDQLTALLAAASDLKYQEARKSRQADQATKHRVAVAALPVTEQEIVMYGEPLWPVTSSPPWTYRELQEACWFIRVLVPMFQAASLHAKAEHQAQGIMQCINLLLKWLPLRDTPFTAAVNRLANLYAANPDGECRVAPAPPNFGLTVR